MPTPTLATEPDLRRQAKDLREALTELWRSYQFRDRSCICCHDVSVTQCNALERLVTGGSLTVNELASTLFLNKSTASRVVDALERKGYARRSPDPEDRRRTLVSATSEGRSLFSRIEEEILEREMAVLADYGPEVRSAVIAAIRRLGTSTAARIETRRGTCCETC